MAYRHLPNRYDKLSSRMLDQLKWMEDRNEFDKFMDGLKRYSVHAAVYNLRRVADALSPGKYF